MWESLGASECVLEEVTNEVRRVSSDKIWSGTRDRKLSCHLKGDVRV